MKNVRWAVLAAVCAAALAAGPARAEGFKDLEKKVVDKTLPNGLRVLMLPRPGAPVTSFVMYADVGGVDENQNATGLAHIFEHMAFKGTTTIGGKDYAKEAVALKKVEDAFLALRAERNRRPKPDEAKLKELETAFAKAQDDAQQYVIPNEFGEVLEKNGAEGLNAFTSFDQTAYHYSLPSNRLELWAALEADRFTHPVLREFYKEKNVIMEEKRMGESQPTRRLLDDFMAVAYKASMYRSFVIGHMSDLEAISRTEAEAWFNKYYRARNLTAVIVGDVDPATAMPILEKRLGQIPAGTKPGPVTTKEPPQRAEKRIVMEDPSQPFVFVAYHKPDVNDPDDAVYEGLSDILAGGRSSRLYKSMVKEKQIALAVGAITQLGQKYPGLMLFYVVPNKGKTNAECEQALYAELEKIGKEPVTAEELAGFKTRSKAQFVDGLDSNMGLAMQLAFAQNLRGDWRELFSTLDRIDKVTADDIQRVARKTFVKSNRTVGLIENVAKDAR
ncbi:MAG: pitrilysin family protein [Candidatus Polarisedimenticolia bacterium]|nr:insulinase family protein [bacterium]